MTDIALHAHGSTRWISWHNGRAFGRIHLTRTSITTLCDLIVPSIGRVVRDQESAAIEDLCKSCLKEYATHH